MDPQDPFDPTHFQLTPEQASAMVGGRPEARCRGVRRRRQKNAGEYLGVANWRWLEAAAQLPGKAFQIGVLLWHLRNMGKAQVVRWQPSKARALRISRFAAYRGLQMLEGAKLVSVERHAGRSPIITILGIDGDQTPWAAGKAAQL